MQDLTGGPTRQGQHETLCKRVTVFIESQIKKTGLANGPTLIEHILVRAKLVFQQGRELLNVVYPGLQRVAQDATGRDLLAPVLGIEPRQGICNAQPIDRLGVRTAARRVGTEGGSTRRY